jgi:hypothetical protein
MPQVQLGKLQPGLAQVALAAAGTDACPNLKAAAQTLLHQKTPHEATGSGHEDSHIRDIVIHLKILN